MKIRLASPIYKYLAITFTAFIAIGSILDAIGNSISIISPRLTYLLSFFVLMLLVVGHLLLKKRPLIIEMKDGATEEYRGINLRTLAVAGGVLLILWIPRFFGNDSSPNADANSGGWLFSAISDQFGKSGEAKRYFVDEFWNKRFNRCSDGWYKARIDTKNHYLSISGPMTGWLAVKGNPYEWKTTLITPTDADLQRGVTWYCEMALAPSVSIAFIDKYKDGGKWQLYHDGLTAMALGGMSFFPQYLGDAQVSQFREEYRTVYLQIYYNERMTPKWNVQVANGRYENMDADLIRSWLILGAMPANCNEFPKLP